MKRSALISDDGIYRYWLRREWEPGGKSLLWVMFNPSTADAEVDDPTIKRCIKFSQSWGFNNLVVANLYAYRSSDPCAIWKCAATEARGPENKGWVTLLASQADSIIVAWGNPGGEHAPPGWLEWRKQPYLYCIGTTKSGAPKHPLARGKHRVPEGAPMLEYKP